MHILISLAATILSIASVQAASMPPPGTAWYWQLDGRVNASWSAKVYDIDMENAPAGLIQTLHGADKTVVCYFSAGTYEATRGDASKFPKAVIGAKLSGWDESYVDIRDPIVRAIMRARMDVAKAKGCDAFEPDVLDAFRNRSGLPITRQDEIDYIRFLASEGHRRGLLVALKNNPEIVQDVISFVDFAIVEQCFQYNECASYLPFVQQGKPVFAAEYKAYNAEWCTKAADLKLLLAFYNLGLNGKEYRPCP